MRSEFGTALVLVTHDPEIASKAPRVVLLRGGKIERVEPGSLRDVEPGSLRDVEPGSLRDTAEDAPAPA